MTVVLRDVSKIWDRLFDHKGFLNGEISFISREFEQKRKYKEVDNLFRVIEVIKEIKDTEIDSCKQTTDQIDKVNENINLALKLCDKFNKLENKYKEDTTLESIRGKRKVVWDNFIEDITTQYSEINTNYESKVEELIKFYEHIEDKILI